MQQIPTHLNGLTESEVLVARKKYGANKMKILRTANWVTILINILKEPMLILLFAVATLYIILGNYGEALFMFGAIVAVSGISFYQDNRSRKALIELEKMNEPLSKVIRNSQLQTIPTHEIVVGDLCVTEEGRMINADGKIVHSNDFSVNEAALTGESFSVFKDSTSEDNRVFSGTLAVSGLAVFQVEQIGMETRISKIGASLASIKGEKSPLQIQIGRFVRTMSFVGVVFFFLVWGVTYVKTGEVMQSLLNGLTLAMSVLPEEIPVAFTTFMALGAWRLMKEGVIIKRSSIVETLGSTTVICADKTGTITENSMQLQFLYDYQAGQVFSENEFADKRLSRLIDYSMWSSEPIPFDPMEKALHKTYEQTTDADKRREYQMIHEYPLEGKPPMMTHIFGNAHGERVIAAKGAPEAILRVSTLTEEEKEKVRQRVSEFGKKGYRVLGVAGADFSGDNFPKKQQNIAFRFLGLTVFFDPPKKGIRQVFDDIYKAGVQVKVITGDYADTTLAIAAAAGIRNEAPPVNGDDIMSRSEDELISLSEKTVLFTRMFPEAKLAVVNALKKDGEVVAMLGDGVNDAPALKAAHIGVAMGHKGTEIAKAAAALVITNDDLAKLITGIAAGRRIYSNIKKAVQYIISIHIPIILTVSLPLFLGWIYPQIFTPVHVIFLELVMGPTCSIVYESEPMEENAMKRPPRAMTETFLNLKELSISIVQGLVITAGVLAVYQLTAWQGGSEEKTRAMVFSTLIFANIFLSYTNRSFYYSIFYSFKQKNSLLTGITLLVLGLTFAFLYFKPFSDFFRVSSLNFVEVVTAILVAAVSVLWFEGFKWMRRKKEGSKRPIPYA